MTKKLSKQLKESNSLSYLIESELEKAELVLAAKAILDKLQKIAEDMARVEANDVMPLLDGIRLEFGDNISDKFNEVTTESIRDVIESVKDAKERISRQISKMESGVENGGVNDMFMSGDDDDTENDMFSDDMDDSESDEIEPNDDENEPSVDSDMQEPENDEPEEQIPALGRAKKESVQPKITNKMITSHFNNLLKESYSATRAAKKTARHFDIDVSDVAEIVLEHTSRHDFTKWTDRVDELFKKKYLVSLDELGLTGEHELAAAFDNKMSPDSFVLFYAEKNGMKRVA